MHKKTNQVLKLSKLFKSNKTPIESQSPSKSIQSEVKSDHEIKEIITELQKEDAKYERRMSDSRKVSDLKMSSLN